MKEFLVIFVIAIIFVGIMFLGLSITRIRKGRDLQSDVGGNDEMKKRGLHCASATFRKEELELRRSRGEIIPECNENCGTCSQNH